MTKIYYHETHYLPIGKPSWEWELNKTARLAIVTTECLAIFYLFFQFAFPKLMLLLTGTSVDQNYMSTFNVRFGILILVATFCYVFCSIFMGPPSVGGMKYSYFKTDLRIDEYGISILLGKDWDSNSYDWSWTCHWENIGKIDIRQEPDKRGFHTMAIYHYGDVSALTLLADGTTKELSPRKRRKLFGGYFKIIIGLGNFSNDIIYVLEHISKTIKQFNIVV